MIYLFKDRNSYDDDYKKIVVDSENEAIIKVIRYMLENKFLNLADIRDNLDIDLFNVEKVESL